MTATILQPGQIEPPAGDIPFLRLPARDPHSGEGRFTSSAIVECRQASRQAIAVGRNINDGYGAWQSARLT